MRSEVLYRAAQIHVFMQKRLVFMSNVSCRLSVSSSSGQEETFDADAVVFAVGVKAMQGIVRSSPDLAACPVGIPLVKSLLFSLHQG